ncbi:protein NLRC3-like protein [Lates japonicus]|uniref:Protein NLRC3-like protein n=1 Tax=Lates japonicus TaxID=270547 RepID=A0AAD3RH98_LATJO|nr:protein NLRC3-like protein [Lates japonicus]
MKQTKAQRSQAALLHSAGPGPGPGPSCLSMKSNNSIDIPLHVKQSVDGRIQQQRPDSLLNNCLSLKATSQKFQCLFEGDL